MNQVFQIILFVSLISFTPIDCVSQEIIQYNNKRQQNYSSSSVTLDLQLEMLSKNITKGHASDKKKAEAIFNWIAKNIHYDNNLRYNSALRDKVYTNEMNVLRYVLKHKSALCGGYAMLYRELCDYAGISAKVIHGYTKKVSGIKRTSNAVHHTWNAVRIDNSWHLLDITWSKSHGTPQNPNEFWFLTPPKDFIKTHLPQHLEWTLTHDKPTLVEFDSK